MEASNHKDLVSKCLVVHLQCCLVVETIKELVYEQIEVLAFPVSHSPGFVLAHRSSVLLYYLYALRDFPSSSSFGYPLCSGFFSSFFLLNPPLDKVEAIATLVLHC